VKQRATVVCQLGTRILLVSRDGTRWSLPGGKASNGEALQEAASRELVEETRLHAKRMRYLFDFTGVRTCHHVFAAQFDSGQVPVPSNEITRCQWVKVTDVRHYPTSTCTQGIVDILALGTHRYAEAPNRYQQMEAFVRNLKVSYPDSMFCG
jgi:8-oxo-dGTP diphosphatase